MSDLRNWLLSVPGHRLEPLFEEEEELVVRTFLFGRKNRKMLKRHPKMEEAMISIVESGLDDPRWQGLFYVIVAGEGDQFTPLYFGAANRMGRKHQINDDLKNIRTSPSKFGHWGYSLDYHMGDLSHEMFGFPANRAPNPRDARWAKALFSSYEPPRLKERVFLYLAPWYKGSLSPSGRTPELTDLRRELVTLALKQFSGRVLNER